MQKSGWHSIIMSTMWFAATLVLVSTSFAQEKTITRNWGMTASMQGGQPVFTVPIWVGQKFVVAPSVGALYVKPAGTVLALGLALRIYQSTGRLTPYWGIRGASSITLPKGGGSTSTNGAGIFYGGEFFINPRFSFAVEEQVNAVLTAPTTISTATTLMATIYF